MKLLLVVLLGLVAIATAQNDPRDFEVLENDDSDDQDLDQDDIENLQKNGTSRNYLDELREALPQHDINDASRLPLSPGYVRALGNSSLAMFDDASATNNQVRQLVTAVSSASASQALSRSARQIYTPLYYCPHRNYLLRWFPVFVGSSLRKVCFVPWAPSQNIIYARCSNRYCRIRSDRRGRCRPSCYARRYILAFCYNLRTNSWGWSWEIRNLPQACRCSTC